MSCDSRFNQNNTKHYWGFFCRGSFSSRRLRLLISFFFFFDRYQVGVCSKGFLFQKIPSAHFHACHWNLPCWQKHRQGKQFLVVTITKEIMYLSYYSFHSRSRSYWLDYICSSRASLHLLGNLSHNYEKRSQHVAYSLLYLDSYT